MSDRCGQLSLCLIIHPDNVWVYIAFYVLAFIGLGLFNMVIWAMITDVIDDAEVKTECGKMVRFIPCIPLQESWDRHFRPEWWEVFFP